MCFVVPLVLILIIPRYSKYIIPTSYPYQRPIIFVYLYICFLIIIVSENIFILDTGLYQSSLSLSMMS